MNPSSFYQTARTFLKRHAARILTTAVLLLLSVMSYVICKEPTQTLLITEWSASYVLPFVAILSIGCSVCARYCVAISLSVGYHVGVVYAALMLEATRKMLPYAKVSVLAILLIFVILGVWAEVFRILLPRWKGKAEKPKS